jgi:hypothetical protein
VVVEVKAVSMLTPLHSAQVVTYLKLSGCPVGLLMNFNVPILTSGVKRLVHPTRKKYKRSVPPFLRYSVFTTGGGCTPLAPSPPVPRRRSFDTIQKISAPVT